MKTIFTFLFVSVALFGFGQQNTFKTRVFEGGESIIYQLTQLNDGSLVSVGDNVYFDSTIDDYKDVMVILKTNTAGTVLASKSITAVNDAAALSVTKTNDGGFVVLGTVADNVVLLKFTASLGLQWKKQYALVNYSDILNVLQTADGGYLIAGDIYNSDLDQTTAFIGKTDTQGNIISSKEYFGYTDNDYTVQNIAHTPDGNYVFLGVSNNNDDTTFLVKIKADLTVIWSIKFNISKDTFLEAASVMTTSDGSIIIAGNRFTPNSTHVNQLMAIKCNSNGIPLWSKFIQPNSNNNNYNAAYSSTIDKQGNYILVGGFEADNNTFSNRDTSYAYAVNITPDGILKWTRTFEENTQDGFTEFLSVIPTADGGYAACGDGETHYVENQEDDFSNDFSFTYGFDSNFETCGEAAGSRGTLENFTIVTDTAVIPTAMLTTDTTTVSLEINDVGDINYLCSVLPLQLLSFNATLQNKSVAVQWTTANEVNTSYFTVERSKDAASFSALQQVAAKGNNAGVQSYNTTDLQPLPGTSYYRLQEVDKDGKITYSSVVPVTMLNNGVIIISPNPVRDVIRVVIQSTANANITCQLIDMKGAVLATQKTSVASGRNEILIPAASLAKGVYILKVIENNTTQTLRFIKE